MGDRKQARPAEEATGIVSKIYGAYYNLLPEPDLAPELTGKLRGRLRLARREETIGQDARKPGAAGHGRQGGLRHRHLVMVGDRVTYTRHGPDETVAIGSLLPRRNALYRAVHSRVQALGANLDRAVVMMSLTEPEPNFRFLDRLLVSCHAGAIRPLVIFSKTDLVAPDSEVHSMVDVYRRLGYTIYLLNLTDPGLATSETFRELETSIRTGTSVIVGRSGTGKSTLLNRILGGSYQKTNEISSVGKGRHTTTNSTLFLYNNNRAFLIDTPGVKEWGISHVNRLEILSGFPELEGFFGRCAFSNCDHRPESLDCGIQGALRDSEAAAENPEAGPGPLHPERLYSLLAMLDSLE